MKVVGRAAGQSSVRAGKTRPVHRAIPAFPDAKPERPPRDITPPFDMPELVPPTFPNRIFDIRSHGAIADGATDCAPAIASSIAAAAAAGGGRVLIPPGDWLTGPIHLRSNIDLHLADGAVVRFKTDPAAYLPPVFVRWAGNECYNFSPLIYARDCENIAITGAGTFLGQGEPWWHWEKWQQQVLTRLYQMVLSNVSVDQRRFCCPEEALRPQFIQPINCRNVLLEDFTIGEGGPFWTIHLAYCQNVIVRRLRINAADGPNNDGIVIDSSRDVLVEDCDLHTHEDCVALKSGMNEDGRRVGKPTENVIVRRTRATAGAGGIAIGSDMSGGVRNVFVHDCHYDGPSAGICLKAARGRGGVVENVLVENITMGRISGDAIRLTTEYPSFVLPAGSAPIFRNIRVRKVACEYAGTAARLVGLTDSALRQILLEDLSINSEEGLQCTAANDVRFVNLRITPRTGPVLSVRDSQEVLIEGLNNAASASVFLDLRGKQTKRIRLKGETSDHSRPAVVLGVDVPRDALVHE